MQGIVYLVVFDEYPSEDWLESWEEFCWLTVPPYLLQRGEGGGSKLGEVGGANHAVIVVSLLECRRSGRHQSYCRGFRSCLEIQVVRLIDMRAIS